MIIGISPDKPARLKKFDDKYGLGFTLLSDEDHAVAEAYGVWVEKKNYGKTYMGVQRSAFLDRRAPARSRRPGPRSAPRTPPPTCSPRFESLTLDAGVSVTATAWALRSSRSTNSSAETWVLSSTTGQAVAGLERLGPPRRAHAPLVAGAQPGEAVLRHRRRQVVAVRPSRTRGSRR